MCFDVHIAASDTREESPAAHQGLNVAVLYAALYSLSEKNVDPWNKRQLMHASENNH